MRPSSLPSHIPWLLDKVEEGIVVVATGVVVFGERAGRCNSGTSRIRAWAGLETGVGARG